VPPTPEVDAIGPAFRRGRLHEVVEQFLSRVLLMPTLFVVEDTHWLDGASRELLGALLAEPAMRPWLVCATRRPAGKPLGREEREDHLVLALQPLDAEATARLALAADEELTLGEEELSAVSARSGGNPLFVRELVAAASAGSSELPETVERLMTERIDTLPADDRLLLRYASVVGQWFDLDVLQDVVAGELQEVNDIERWQRLSDFVERGSEDSFFFRHELFRVAAYEGLSFRRRREIHGLVGDVLEQRFEGRTDEAAGLLSHHFLEAGNGPRAWRYSVVAGQRARSRLANVDATEFFGRALRAADELEAASTLEVAEVAEALGDVCELSARYEDARAAYRRARAALANNASAQLRLTRKEGTLLERLGHYDEAVAWFKRALETAPGEDDAHASDVAELELEYAVVLYRQGHFADCFRVSEQAAARAERVGDRAALAHAYRLLDSADRALGGLDESWLAKALPIYEELGDPIGRAITLNNWGIRAYYAGRWDDAQAFYAQSREAEQTSGDVVRAATASNNEAEILLDQGHTERAAGLFRDALRVYRASGYSFGAAVVVLNLARAEAAAGRFEEAHRLFDEAHAELAAIGSESFLLELDMRRSECFVLEGSYAEALELATATLEASEAAGEAGPRLPLLERVRGYAHIQARRAEQGRERLDASLAAARESGNDFEAALTLRALSLTDRPEHGPEADDLFRRLGVVTVRSVPLP
jgi:tetratricopeptide (TPR) repeat protein